MTQRASMIAKGIAIAMMLTHHLFFSAEIIGSHVVSFAPFSSEGVIQFAQSCKTCVAVFVFITAYGTYKSMSSKMTDFRKEELCSYCITHALKLLLSFWAVFVLFQVLGLLIGGHDLLSVYFAEGKLKGLLYFVIDSFGLATLFGSPTFNPTWWYMSLAYLLVFLTPLLVVLARNVGSFWMPILFSAGPILAGLSMRSNLLWWSFSLALGLVCAQYGLFEKMREKLKGKTGARVAAFAGLVLLLATEMYIRQRVGAYFWAFDGVGALLVCAVAHCLDELKLGGALALMGRHSMNMFMCHTFIFKYYFADVVYGFSWFGLILVALIVMSLASSVVIEFLKEKTQYTRFSKQIVSEVGKKIANS